MYDTILRPAASALSKNVDKRPCRPSGNSSSRYTRRGPSYSLRQPAVQTHHASFGCGLRLVVLPSLAAAREVSYSSVGFLGFVAPRGCLPPTKGANLKRRRACGIRLAIEPLQVGIIGKRAEDLLSIVSAKKSNQSIKCTYVLTCLSQDIPCCRLRSLSVLFATWDYSYPKIAHGRRIDRDTCSSSITSLPVYECMYANAKLVGARGITRM